MCHYRVACIVSLMAVVVGIADGDDETDKPPIALVEVQRTDFVFDKDVFPILESKCTTCHDAEGGLAEGDLDLLTVESILKGGKSGPAIVASKGDESSIVRLAGHRAKPYMPPDDNEPLTSEELSVIQAWIDQGAKPGDDPRPAESRRQAVVLEDLPPGVHPVCAVTLDPTGTLAAVGCGVEVVLFDVAGGAIMARLSGHQDVVSSLKWSPDGQWLAAGGYEKVLLWPRTNPRDPMPPTWGEPLEVTGILERATALAFSPDSKLIAIGAGIPSSTGQILLWDLNSKQISRTWDQPHSDVVYGLAFRPDGKLIASGSADKFLKVHSMESGELVRTFEGHTGHVLATAWSPDGALLATASADKTIKIWNFESGEQVRTIDRHGGEITGLEWLSGSNQLLTSCADKRVRLIQSDNGEILRAMGAEDFLLCTIGTPDGKRILGGSQTGDVYIWNGEDGKLLETVRPATPLGSETKVAQ